MEGEERKPRKGDEGAWDVLSKAVMLRAEEYFLKAWTVNYYELGNDQAATENGMMNDKAYGLLALTNMRLLFVAPRTEEIWRGFAQPPLDPLFIEASSGCYHASAKERFCLWQSFDLEDIESFALKKRKLSPTVILSLRWWHRGHPHTVFFENLLASSSFDEQYVWTISAIRPDGAEPIDRAAFKAIFNEALKDRWAEVAKAKSSKRASVVVDFSDLRKLLEAQGISLKSIKCPSCGGVIQIPTAGAKKSCEYCGSNIYAMQVTPRSK